MFVIAKLNGNAGTPHTARITCNQHQSYDFPNAFAPLQHAFYPNSAEVTVGVNVANADSITVDNISVILLEFV